MGCVGIGREGVGVALKWAWPGAGRVKAGRVLTPPQGLGPLGPHGPSVTGTR